MAADETALKALDELIAEAGSAEEKKALREEKRKVKDKIKQNEDKLADIQSQMADLGC